MTDALADQPELAAFLDREPAATLAVPIDEHGTVHAAALLYWHRAHPLTFFFVTGKDSEKCQLLKERQEVKAACVVGAYRGTDFTLQMRGRLRILDKDDHQEVLTAYYVKRGNRHDDIVSPDNVLLGFTPNWARYTNYAKGYDRHFLVLSKAINDHT